ncbi:MAG: PP2C family protein-serine/threonine phosphatase [Marmoricola sp.]
MTSELPDSGKHVTEARPDRWPAHTDPFHMARDIRREMAVDSVSILTVDAARDAVNLLAIDGLDRTTRGARPIPIGQGFAGRIAQLRRPVVLHEVNDTTVLNPMLVKHGIQSLLGVPIVRESELLGVVHVGERQHHDFTEDEILHLSDIARDLAITLASSNSSDGHTAALALQRSLLPATFRVPSNVEVAARYIPAEGDLGGDWYDVFELPDRRLVVVMGDVVGHGFEAAIVMGRLRSSLRSYAMEHSDPATILRHVDEKICHFEPGILATILLGISEAPYTHWAFSSAGHPRPIIAAPGEPTHSADMPTDTLIGVASRGERHTTEIHLPQGGSLCLFTDGLVERRPGPEDGERDIIAENVDLVCKTLTDSTDPEAACIQVLGDVVGDFVTEDDIALLIAKIDAS